MNKLPYAPRGEMFGVVREMNGAARATVICEDEKGKIDLVHCMNGYQYLYILYKPE